jgi:LmbE family N-acetylglucosaminyl deacetylase
MNAFKQVAIVVAHPDDETLWAGGTLLNHPEWHVFIACLSRKNDPDRAPKFKKLLHSLQAEGEMGDMDDGPEQLPLADREVENIVLSTLPDRSFDLVITHSVLGEYTRHRRHEETGSAVIRLWQRGCIKSDELWLFAYEDGERSYYPRAIIEADHYTILNLTLWKMKYDLIRQTYGFTEDSWEARTTPKEEAFRCFSDPIEAAEWVGNLH